jgi:hypothetical protein
VPKLPLEDRPATAEPRPATPAPAWVAFVTAWLGLLMLVGSIVLIFLPRSRNPVLELEHRQSYSWADRFLPVPIYGITVTLFLGIVVLRQMRHEPRPLPQAMVAQRVQAWVGIILALFATIIIYSFAALRGPKS